MIVAPVGFEACEWLDHWKADRSTELLVIDPGQPFVDRSRAGLRHIPAGDAEVQHLIAVGLGAAQGEWIVLSEDHCRPLPGLLAAYAAAIAAHPEADLFAGSLVNQTSTQPWSQAAFLTSMGGQTAGFAETISEPTNANLMVRRSALKPEERDRTGGLLGRAVPRLIAEGRFAACPAAVADHVLPFTRSEAIAFQYLCSRGCYDLDLALDKASALAAPAKRSPLRTVWRIVAGDPIAKARRLPGSPFTRAAMAARMSVLGWAVVGAIVTSRLARWLGRSPQPTHAHVKYAG